MSYILEIEGLTKAFGKVKALRGITLKVPRTGIFGIVGPNGAGKTTLFSIICGFLSQDEGKVIFDGKTDPKHRLGQLATFPQDAKFMTGVTVGKHLSYYAQLGRMNKADARAEAIRVLELVGLPEVFKRKGNTLSHGMYKRVGIAQAFMGNPQLIILDEPTAGLDPHSAREVRAQLRTLCGDRTIIVSTHNLTEIEDMCTEVAILAKGVVVTQERIDTLVGTKPVVSFRMAEAPPEAVLQKLNALDFVESASWDVGAARVKIRLIASKPADEASGELVVVLVQNQVKFLEMQVGSSLEEQFIAETR